MKDDCRFPLKNDYPNLLSNIFLTSHFYCMKNLPFLRTSLFLLTSLFFVSNTSAFDFFSNTTNGAISINASTGNEAPVSCYTPTWPTTSNITMTSATFSWDAVPGAVTYSVQTRVINGTWFNVPGSPTSATSINVTWFLSNTTYEWRVKANCSGGESSPYTWPVTFTTLGWGYCNAPDWLYTTGITQTSATFDWEPVSGALNYSLQYRLVGGSWIDVPGGPFSGTWHTIYGLQPGTAYEWRVRSNCANWMYSSWSYSAGFTTLGYSCSHPYWLSTTNISQNSATFNWEYVPGAYNYSIQMRQCNGYWYDLPGGPWSGTWYTVHGLEPGTCYEWRIRSNCSNWSYSSWSYPQTFWTNGYSCATPTWPATYGITHTSATFSWSLVSGAYNYTVQIRMPNGEWYDLPGSPTHSTWFTVTNLDPCTTYNWRVKANCGYGSYSYWTSPIPFTTLCGYNCDAPYWLQTTGITESSAVLEWEPVIGAMSYSIQYRVTGGTWQYLPGGPWTGTWAHISWLQPATTYEWRVRSNCFNWTSSEWSYGVWFTTLGNTCHRPSHLSTHDITTTSATLKWSSVYGAWSYDVEIRVGNGSWTPVPGSPFTSLTATVTGLEPGTTYQWRVRTYCEYDKYSLWTKPKSFTTLHEPKCDPPYWLVTNSITESSGNLDWSDIINGVSYDIQWRPPGGDWIDLAAGPQTETWYTLTGLMSGTWYEWRVRTNCNNGLESEWSFSVSFKTLGPSCAIPTGGYTSDVTDTSVTFNWNAVAGAESYVIQARVPYGIWIELPGSPFTETSVAVDGFIPGTQYEWRLRANCTNGDHSPWTALLSFTTTGVSESGSDECDDAIELTVNSECQNIATSNEGATESVPGPMGWCAENEYNDVWYRFTMPDVANPEVTIRTTAGTLTDAIMELYRGGGCGDLEYIFCEDDNTWANGSHMPVVTITGMPNETIWVRVWGYAGTTGSFSICVFDYASSNFAAPLNATDVSYDGIPLDSPALQTADEKDGRSTLLVTPNPTSDVLQINYLQTDASMVTRIVMMDMSGRIVYDQNYKTDNVRRFTDQINVSGWSTGIYVLKVVTTEGIMSERISVVK